MMMTFLGHSTLIIIIIYTGGFSGSHSGDTSSLPSLQSHPLTGSLAPQNTGEM